MHRFRISMCVGLLLLGLMATFAAEGGPLRVGLVLSLGGLGDRSFNDATYAGVTKLRQIPGCQVDVFEPSDIDSMESGLSFMATRKYDLIAGVGLFANEPLRRVAEKYPDQKFVLIDSVVTLPNVLSIIFNEEEGSFYAGALAGLLTKTGKVVFLGGMQSPMIAAFEKGFLKGVSFVNPQAQVMVRYAGTSPDAFNSPELGSKLGKELADNGADLIYHAAGRTGLGLIETARRNTFLVIGVDSDQNALAPGKIAGSMVKRMDVALDRAARSVIDNNFKGCVLTLGLADDGTELVLSKFNRNLFTPVIQERLKEVAQFLNHQGKPVIEEKGASK